MKTKLLYGLFALILVVSTLLPLLTPTTVLAGTGVTVSTSTNQKATGGEPAGHHRKLFYYNGRHWLFYSDQTGYLWRTSTDGTTWSASTLMRADDGGAGTANGDYFSIWFDGTYVHYAYSQGSMLGLPLYYRMGTPNTDGTITWACAEEIAVAGVALHRFYCPIITVDATGYPWIGYYYWHDALGNQDSIVTTSSTGNGTWTTVAAFPYTFSAGINHCAPTLAVPQAGNKTYGVYVTGVANDYLYGKPWDGSSWGASELIGEMPYTDNLTFTSNGDIVYAVYVAETTNNIMFRERSALGSWSAAVTIAVTAGSHIIFPSVSLWNASGDLRVVWSDPSLPNGSGRDHIFYVKRTGGVWGSTWDWVNEETDDLASTNEGYLVSADRAYSGYVGVAYTTRTGSPYNVKFILLSLASITTGNATGVTPTSMTLNGDVISVNDTTITEEGFDWGLATGVYTGNWTQAGSYGVGTFSYTISSLAPSTTYYFRAKACNSDGWAYGAEVTATTTSSGAPTVTTGAATSVTTTSATLQGSLDSMGGYSPVYAYFQYGLTTSYGTTTSEQTMVSTGGVNQAISSLTPGILYHFRIVVRYGVTSYAYGADGNFTTTTLGLPTVTTQSAAGIGVSSATLQGALTGLGDYSTVYVSFEYGLSGSYGATTSEQTKTSITGFTQAVSGLTPNTLYHYRARVRYATASYVNGADVTFTTLTAAAPSGSLRILGAQVYRDYHEAGDLLFVFEYENTYPPYYTLRSTVSDYFVFQILNPAGNVTLHQDVCEYYDHMPASIYLSADTAASMEPRAAYIIRLYGTFAGNPYGSYTLSPADWMGNNFRNLGQWVIQVAKNMQVYWEAQGDERIYVMTASSGEEVEILTPIGGKIFNYAIKGLSSKIPDFFSKKDIAPSDDRMDYPAGLAESHQMADKMGADFEADMTSLGTTLGLSATETGQAVWWGLALILGIAVGAITKSGIFGLFMGTATLVTGVYFGMVNPGFIAAAAVVIIFVWGFKEWVLNRG